MGNGMNENFTLTTALACRLLIINITVPLGLVVRLHPTIST